MRRSNNLRHRVQALIAGALVLSGCASVPLYAHESVIAETECAQRGVALRTLANDFGNIEVEGCLAQRYTGKFALRSTGQSVDPAHVKHVGGDRFVVSKEHHWRYGIKSQCFSVTC